jgi:hypothetical protein
MCQPVAAAAPRAVPARLVGGRGLPQHEIAGVALVGGDLDPGAGDHLVAAAARQLAVGGPRGDREQHVPLGGIGVAGRDQPLDHRDHLRHVAGAARLDIGRQRVQRRHVGVELRRRARGQRVDRLAVGAGGVDDPVVDIGDVASVTDMLGAVGVT